MELLLRRLGAQRDEISFEMVGAEIRAATDDGIGDSTTQESRVEIARQDIFEIVSEVCDEAPELEADWFAVSYVR
jgi:hypothetical protein